LCATIDKEISVKEKEKKVVDAACGAVAGSRRLLV
jgi:hypothetical protein